MAREGEARRQRSLIQGEMGLSMLGRRQVTPGWENCPVWRHDGQKGREGRGRAEIGWRAEKGGAVQRRIAT